MSQPGSPSSPGPSTVSPSKATKQSGTSIFPTARVARIIKADRDVDICSKEATFLISLATEIFVRKLTDEAYTNAKLDKRKNIFYKDLSRAVQQTEYLEFLKDAIPTPMALTSALGARQEKLQQKQVEENMILEGTLQDDDEEEDEEEDAEEEEGEEAEKDEDADEQNGTDGHDEPEGDAAVTEDSSSTKKKLSPKKNTSKSKAPPAAEHKEVNGMDQDDD
ncbi:Transcription factor CBF/NF-Y/archaeal histone [Kalmanozyma brasiliensis GHG001]|uniref:Transcription factor CBF/NF-Y/archaeal histone domain-containing protein n=1 Tax=Kalmanozyma brasiliensis (strain GHG001) TaxID=1365824 RepID=V5ED91_KALBG|nr:Transcription factor CBF/NF-Y/archaeal histone [Kalmanozyma brasiliensis GHG001]EST08456.1 Transcription factor CBF/NF-Y/archaeal histone [Kalmanozyma brasiliensis GHG001]